MFVARRATAGGYNIGHQASNAQQQYRRVEVKTTDPNPLKSTKERLLPSPPVGRTRPVASRQRARRLSKPSLLAGSLIDSNCLHLPQNTRSKGRVGLNRTDSSFTSGCGSAW